MSDAPAIEVSGVVKRYGEVVALDGLDLSASHGQVVGLLGPNGAGKTTLVRVLATLLKADAGTARVLGLLGPNGAGKTTLVRVLATLLKADAGEARVLGVDVRRDAARLRERIGLAGQYAAVDENLTGLENLTMVGRCTGPGAPPPRRARTSCWSALN